MPPRKYDDNPPDDPVKRILHVVEHRGRPDDQPYRVKPRPKRPRRKRNPTDKPQGGWKGAETSLLALDQHRERTYVQNLRHCAKEGCRQVAVKGVDFCRHHGGRHELNVRRALDPDYRPKRTALTRREVHAALRESKLPLELVRQPVFLRVVNAMFDKLPDYGTPGAVEARTRRRQAQRLVLELLHAWTLLADAGDASAWVNAAAKAHKLDF